jgi:hypothetical protein
VQPLCQNDKALRHHHASFYQRGCVLFVWDIHYPIVTFGEITFFREFNEKESNKETTITQIV